MVNFETKFCNLNLLCKKCDRRHIRLAFEFAQVKIFNFDLKEPETDLDLKMDNGVGQVYCQSIIRKNI